MNNRVTKGNVEFEVHVDPAHQKVYLMEHMPIEHRTLRQKAADIITQWGGSWTFIGVFLIIMAVWILINLWLLSRPFDPFPFILLNLLLSTLAAIQAPIILMSQNRAAERDRKKAHMDFMVDKKAETEIRDMQQDLDEVKAMLKAISPKAEEAQKKFKTWNQNNSRTSK
ncbi:MAG: DUF1003 domain-containing protein [Candidatus Diapherotrites archaeon]|nr:DUF1003 domain-containing protein [Candidatus Diapherotrites archaeon]